MIELKNISAYAHVNYGRLFDNKDSNDPNKRARKLDQIYTAITSAQSEVRSSFTFALTLLCLGIVLIIFFILVI